MKDWIPDQGFWFLVIMYAIGVFNGWSIWGQR